MKIKALVFAFIAACLTSGAAFAHPNDHQRDRGHRYEREWRPDHDRHHRHYGHHGRHGHYHGHYGHRHQDRYYARHRGAGPHRDIYIGQHLPNYYWDRTHWVNWRAQALPRPTPHHNWVRVGDDYVLISIHSGRVAHVLVHR